jgi:hypothetical protein
VSSPGSGKTSLLVRTIQMLAGRVPVAVVEGDQQTSNDADRIRATGVAGAADQHRQGLPPGRRTWSKPPSNAWPRCRLGADDRKRRQPGLPGRLSISAKRTRSWCCR